jgi:hypothetical protein
VNHRLSTQYEPKKCPNIETVNSIIKLNKTIGLILIGNKLEYIGITKDGYKLLNLNSTLINLDDKRYDNKSETFSLINLNRILFLFQVRDTFVDINIFKQFFKLVFLFYKKRRIKFGYFQLLMKHLLKKKCLIIWRICFPIEII